MEEEETKTLYKIAFSGKKRLKGVIFKMRAVMLE